MIDTHTHLYLEQFKDDIDDVISRAKNVGVHRFYLPSISSKYNKSMRDLEKKFPDDISCMIGLHPCYVDDNFESEINFVKKQIDEYDYKAIGEIGIDLFHEKKYFTQQVIAFEQQIKLAIEYDLPIVIHSRDSFDEIFKVLEKFKSDDILLKSISLGTIGDCFSELNQPDEAFEYYQKAFKHNENIYTTPKYLFKAALIGSEIGNYKSAINFLNRIKDDFPDSYESGLVEVQLGRIENLNN